MAGATQQDRLNAEMAGMRIEVRNLTKILRALSKSGADAQSMKDLMHSTGMIIVEGARGLTPARSGALRASLRAGRGKTKAVVRAGGARVPYAGVIHYGYPMRNIEKTMFMVRSLERNRQKAVDHIESGLGDLLRKNGLVVK